jgi:septal ring factor EnvC (AmiA/AmiB activator)
MATLASNPPEIPMTQNDYFQALEERIVRAVELLKSERERRVSAEQQNTELTRQREEQSSHISRLEDEISGLKKEREAVRQRVERLLGQLDEL